MILASTNPPPKSWTFFLKISPVWIPIGEKTGHVFGAIGPWLPLHEAISFHVFVFRFRGRIAIIALVCISDRNGICSRLREVWCSYRFCFVGAFLLLKRNDAGSCVESQRDVVSCVNKMYMSLVLEIPSRWVFAWKFLFYITWRSQFSGAAHCCLAKTNWKERWMARCSCMSLQVDLYSSWQGMSGDSVRTDWESHLFLFIESSHMYITSDFRFKLIRTAWRDKQESQASFGGLLSAALLWCRQFSSTHNYITLWQVLLSNQRWSLSGCLHASCVPLKSAASSYLSITQNCGAHLCCGSHHLYTRQTLLVLAHQFGLKAAPCEWHTEPPRQRWVIGSCSTATLHQRESFVCKLAHAVWLLCLQKARTVTIALFFRQRLKPERRIDGDTVPVPQVKNWENLSQRLLVCVFLQRKGQECVVSTEHSQWPFLIVRHPVEIKT